MAVTKITYPAKSRGDLWMSSEANEVKAVVNNNADELSALQATVSERINVPALVPIVEQSDVSAVISPNVMNLWTSPVASLSIQFEPGTQGKVNEYKLEFIVGGSSFAITLPSGVRWLGGEEPEWNDGYTYQVSIENSLAVGGGWPAS
jgi:hypothetical protein